jgi:hypothetical protein
MAAPRTRLARPPFVDPNTNIIYDTDNPEFQGYLTKQSMWLKVRQSRKETQHITHSRHTVSSSHRCAFVFLLLFRIGAGVIFS